MRPHSSQSVKKLKIEEKEWALSLQGFKRIYDDASIDITQLLEDDKGLYYKNEPYTTKELHQRLIITHSPKYALYQKSVRDNQIGRTQKMLNSGSTKKNRKIQMTQFGSLEQWQLQKKGKLLVSNIISMKIKLLRKLSMTDSMQYAQTFWIMRSVMF